MLSIALFLLQAAASPHAPAADAASDGRCLAVFASLVEEKDPVLVEAATKGALYFAGRLDGRDSALDMTAAMRVAAVDIQPIFKSEVARCSAELKRAGSAMIAAGSALQAK